MGEVVRRGTHLGEEAVGVREAIVHLAADEPAEELERRDLEGGRVHENLRPWMPNLQRRVGESCCDAARVCGACGWGGARACMQSFASSLPVHSFLTTPRGGVRVCVCVCVCVRVCVRVCGV